jgi:hypothetical protein
MNVMNKNVTWLTSSQSILADLLPEPSLEDSDDDQNGQPNPA